VAGSASPSFSRPTSAEAATAISLHHNRFPPERRLRSRADFEQVYANGRSWSHPLLGLRVKGGGHGRVGFAVGKRLGGAVVRNRVKRRLRDVTRHLRLVPTVDVVVIARAPAVAAAYSDLRDAMVHVLSRAGALALPVGESCGASS
jgi:ribonuclease P protein component